MRSAQSRTRIPSFEDLGNRFKYFSFRRISEAELAGAVNKHGIQMQDTGTVSHIRCQHPTCSNCPHLRYVFWVGPYAVGSECIDKLYGGEIADETKLLSEEAWTMNDGIRDGKIEPTPALIARFRKIMRRLEELGVELILEA